jgi:SAM-dependent methyltransferase
MSSSRAGIDRANWESEQRDYWSALAPEYDSFYRSRWSRLENEWTELQLASLVTSPQPVVVDLGCGTGLGAELLSRHISLGNYLGVDISPEMTAITASLGVATHVGDMDDLTIVQSGSTDMVVSIFSAVSFSQDPSALFAEVRRVLKPGGVAYLSVLGRTTSKAPRPIRFRTRGAEGNRSSTPAFRYSPHALRRLATEAGLRVQRIEGMNSLSGVLELPIFWGFGRIIARLLPSTSHLLELVCTQPVHNSGGTP